MPLVDLLSRGYFPKELPRPFNTQSYASVLNMANPLPGDYSKNAAPGAKIKPGKAGHYSLLRSGLSRRPLSICNPLHYYLLSKELIQNWAALEALVSGSKIAATAPAFKVDGRAIQGKDSLSARVTLAQQVRIGRRYILQTDISRFYSSIYTHSIPWAIHTKEIAKANRGPSLFGNKIDYWVRSGQDEQTLGIPIGPDSSLVLAELIMHKCDHVLLAKMPKLKGFRFIDDYELSFQTRTEAEDAFSLLEACLAEYELALNLRKTHILELPQPLEPPWATDLKRFEFRSTQSGQAADLTNYFSRAFSLHSEYPEDAVMQFAIAQMRKVQIHSENWELFQRLLLLCVLPEPATFPYALEQIITWTNKGFTPILPELEEIANELVVVHSGLRHSSEVANAAWACLALGLKLNNKAVDCISKCDDPVVALLALDCEQHNLVTRPLEKSLWSSHMAGDSLYDEYWLLAYEAYIKGWLPSKNGQNYVRNDPNFGYLMENKVQFYDINLASPIIASPVPLPTLPTTTEFESGYSL